MDPVLTNSDLIDDIFNSPDGQVKMASSVATKATRTQVREEGFFRQILQFKDITNADLDYLGDSELPGVWFELEPDSPGARTIPYNSTPHSIPYRAEKYIVLISVITTEEATKNINELRRYKTDVRQMVADNMLRDIHTEEDVSGITYCARLVGSQVNLSTGPSVEVQNVHLQGAVNRVNYKRAINFLTDRRLPNGVFLVNQRTATEILGWHRDEVGDDSAGELLRRGLKALEKFEIMGVEHISTIKNNLVLNGQMWQFAPQEFLGNALRLEDINVTLKKEYDILRMRAQEQVGMTIGNPRGLQLLEFVIGN